jgi:N-acylneuraminate cytidylyltransferase
MKTLAIIPARGGSKRIPKKNVKDFLGQPIINYSIDAALNAGCFDEVMVSTDDPEIAEIAKKAGAKIPFMRSRITSGDFSTTVDVIKEVLDEYRKIGKHPEYVCCIYPTAPFITSGKLLNAFNLISSKKAESVVPVVRFSFPILRSFKIEDGLVKLNWPEYRDYRSQDLPLSFHDCGQFYLLHVPTFLEKFTLFPEHTLPLEMAESEVQDIDNDEDWKIAELKYKIQYMNSNIR